MHKNMPVRLMSTTVFHCSTLRSSSGIAGAPVPADTVEGIRSLCDPQVRFWTPYGATECLPVTVIEGRELQSTARETENGLCFVDGAVRAGQFGVLRHATAVEETGRAVVSVACVNRLACHLA